MAKEQVKEHAILVEEDDEEVAETSTGIEDKALHIVTNLSLDEIDAEWAL